MLYIYIYIFVLHAIYLLERMAFGQIIITFTYMKVDTKEQRRAFIYIVS